MITYEAVYDPESDNVFSVSLVESPAMESLFITLSKQDVKEQKIQLAEVDKKERTLLGVCLIPDKPIYRNQDGNEFYITFPKETIKASAHDFFTKGFQTNSKLEHESEIKNISFVESWVVKDPKTDTALAYGLPKEDIVEGAWIMKMKCDNDEIYKKALSGEIKGFSIDGLFSLKEINLKKEDMSVSITEAIEKGFENFLTHFKKSEDVQLGSVKSGEVDVMFDGEAMEVGGAVWVVGEEDAKIALPIGDYPLEDGSMLVVTEEGVVGAINATAAEEEAPAELENEDKQAQEIASAIKSVLIKYKEQADIELKESNEVLLKEIKELSNKVVELSEQPAAKKIVTAPTQPTNKRERILQSLRQN